MHMQMTFVVDIDDTSDLAEEEIGSHIEDQINAIYTSNGINRCSVQKVYLTRPESLVRIDEDTAVRLST